MESEERLRGIACFDRLLEIVVLLEPGLLRPSILLGALAVALDLHQQSHGHEPRQPRRPSKTAHGRPAFRASGLGTDSRTSLLDFSTLMPVFLPSFL